MTGSGANTAERRPLRALYLQAKIAPLSVVPADCAQHECTIETAKYGSAVLSRLLKTEFDVIVACVVEGQTAFISPFLREIRRTWPWIAWVVIGPSSTPEAAQLARDMDTSHVLEPCGVGKLCTAIRSAAAEAEAGHARYSGPVHRDIEQKVARDLGLMAQNAMEVPTLSGVLGHISRKLIDFLPSSVVCVMSTGDEHVLDMATRVPVNRNLLQAVQNEALTRFHGFGGSMQDKTLLRMQSDHAIEDIGGYLVFARAISIPVMDDEEIVGLLTLADPENSTPFTRSEVAVLAAASIHVSALLSALKSVRLHASRDPLTGVLNRIGLKDELDHAWSMSRRYDFPLTIMLMDLDSFKLVNDSYGHSVGDRIICEVAQLLSGVARASDIVARYGGDEFVIVLLEATEEGARVFANRLLGVIRGHLFRSQDERLRMTASLGVASVKSGFPAATASELFNRADRALYTAKREGRNRVCFWLGETLVAGQGAPEAKAGPADPGSSPVECGKLMAIDDDPAILRLIQVIMEPSGVKTEIFSDADSAIRRLREAGREEFAVILTDLKMPGKSGLKFLNEIRAINEFAVKIVMTGFATVENTVSSLREGVYDVVQKPCTADEFMQKINKAMAYYRLKVENAHYRDHLQELVTERSAQLASSLEELRTSHEFTLNAMVAMLDAREYQTAKHSWRVREMAVALGKRVGFDDRQIESLAKGALLHDIGKISVPDEILLKPGPLLPEEWEVMKRHPETGYRILSAGLYMKDVAELVRSHHERYDGTGYPMGLKGRNIPAGARVFSVADAYEAMTSDRVYRAAMPAEEAIKRIREGSGTQFDPQIVDVLLECQPDFLAAACRINTADRGNP